MSTTFFSDNLKSNWAFGTKPDLGAETWIDREAIAFKFHLIDFGCDFHGDGTCAGSRSNRTSWSNKKNGCCHNCASSHGYLRAVNPEDVEFLDANFDENDGFWREGKGCILPRTMRSNTCLTYRCDAARANTPRATLQSWLWEIRDLVGSSMRGELYSHSIPYPT